MKKILFLLSLLFALNAQCQYDINGVKNDSVSSDGINWFELRQRIYVGGEVGLSFGYGAGYIYLAPLVGYDITDQFSVGISGMYQLWRNTLSGQNFNSFGGGIFTRFRPIPQVITQLEFDYFNTYNIFNLNERVNVPAFMFGLGYANDFGGGVYYQIMLMYDFINDPNMPLPPLIIDPLHLKMGLIWHLG